MPVLVSYENDFEDSYYEATRGLTPAESDSFAQYFVGAVGPYLPPEAVMYCIAVAKTLQERDEAQSRYDTLATAIIAEAGKMHGQQSQKLFLVKR